MQAIVRRLEAHGITDARRYYPWESKREFNEFLLGDGPISMEQLLENGYATFSYELGDFDRVGFKAYIGKIELFSEKLAELGLDPLPDYIPPHVDQTLEVTRQEYPLTLLTGAREKTYHHSRFRDQVWARKVSNDPWLQMNPITAEKYGLLENDWVVVETIDHNGQCRLRVRVTEDVLPDVLRTGMGWWYPEAAGPEFGSLDININAAIAYDGLCDPVTGSVDTRGIRCRLTKTNIATAGE